MGRCLCVCSQTVLRHRCLVSPIIRSFLPGAQVCGELLRRDRHPVPRLYGEQWLALSTGNMRTRPRCHRAAARPVRDALPIDQPSTPRRGQQVSK